MRRKTGSPLGVYVHLPFCARRCPYCDAPVVEGTPAEDAPYRAALSRELSARASRFEDRSLETISFGGGTPSAVPRKWIAEIADEIRGRWPGANPTVTLEANPEDVDEARLDAWRAAGVDRLVVGVQSFDAALLERIGRPHSPEKAAEALRRAIAAPEFAVGADLLFGVAGQPLEVWRSDLERLAAEAPDLAGLYLYEYTPVSEGPDAAEETDEMFELGKEAAAAMELPRTGVASFETNDFESRHTQGYWTGWEYLGAGMAASSLRIGGSDGDESGVVFRRRNAESLEEYRDDPLGSAVERRVGAQEYFADRVALAMRTSRGLDWEEVRRQFEGAIAASTRERGRDVLRRLVDSGRAERVDECIRPTEAGLDVADAIDREVRRRVLEVGSR